MADFEVVSEITNREIVLIRPKKTKRKIEVKTCRYSEKGRVRRAERPKEFRI